MASLFPLLLLLAGAPTAAQSPPETLRIPRVTHPPKIEAFLNDTLREAEARVTGFRQFLPGDGLPVSEETTAYLSYDDKNLYVVFVCKDEPGKVRAHLAKREEIGSDDDVEVDLDTFHNRQRAYNFVSNPLGIQLDYIYTEGQGADTSFDTLWHSEGRLTADGYIVWIAIPFKSLRFPHTARQEWGIALGRDIVRRNEFSTWPYITSRIDSYVQQFATLEGLENISPNRNVQLIPYGQFARARFLDATNPSKPEFRIDNEARGGLDAKFVARDALTFDLTLNPDFSQVESDEPQVTINQRFEVFFPEKRPFFIENAGFFQAAGAANNLFFSRRIADPQFGIRMTGKVRQWTLGFVAIDDRGPGKGRLPADPLAGERAGIGALRVQREFGQQSWLGAEVTSSDFARSSNRVFSVDARLKLNPNWVLTGQAVKSYTHDLAGNRFSGPAYFASLSRAGRGFVYTGSYLDRSPNFHTELGFIPRVDIRQTEQFAGYFWRPEKSVVVAYGPSASALVNWNRAGQVQDWNANAGFEVKLAGKTDISVSRGEAFELFQNIGFRKHSTAVSASTQWLKWLGVSGRYSQGTVENFFPPAPFAPFLAQTNRASFGLTWRPASRLRFDETYIYSRLTTREGSTPLGFSPGTPIFNNHLVRSKVNYQFTRELSLRAILDYNATLANPNLVDEQTTLGNPFGGPPLPTKRFTADLLLTYLLHPGTAFYIGYTDRYDNRILEPTAPPRVGFLRSPSTSTGRQFFVKLSYLFRF